MSYDESRDFYRKSWEQDVIYLCIDRSKRRDQGRYCIGNESKNTFSEGIQETKPL